MLRRDLLKGLLGLVGGELLLKDISAKEKKQDLYINSDIGYDIGNLNYCCNEFRMLATGDVKPGNHLYCHCQDGTISTKKSDSYTGIALSTKDKYGCCRVALYLE